MGILNKISKIFRKKATERKKRKYVNVYISDKREKIIIAPCHEDKRGLVHEQEKCSIFDFPIDNNQLGNSLKNNLDLYYYMDEMYKMKKQSDWPAYKTSKCKTIRTFEKEYICIRIEIIMARNLFYTLTGIYDYKGDLLIHLIVNFHSGEYELAKGVISVYEACKKLKS